MTEAEPTVTEPLVTIPKSAPQVYTTTPNGLVALSFHKPELSDLESKYHQAGVGIASSWQIISN